MKRSGRVPAPLAGLPRIRVRDVAIAAAILLLPRATAAQMRCSSPFLVTGGLSWESYEGNFAAVTLPTVDSTDHAMAAVGELGACGRRTVFQREDRVLELNLDAGLRQFAALGFQLRDYAPREVVWRGALEYQQYFEGLGYFTARGAYRGRAVEDRPPMPLFLQPGYSSLRASTAFQLDSIQSVAFDAIAEVERLDYDAPRLLPQLDLLDRRAEGIEVGALALGAGDWRVRFFAGVRRSRYSRQPTEEPTDPFRRDRSVNVGALWSLDRLEAERFRLRANVGVEGTVNRSNSRRPEYDALSLTSDLYYAGLPIWDLDLRAQSLLTWKTYLHQTQFARLVPGEEADNASVVHVDFIRTLAPNLDGVFRFGWTRAETDIGDAYYQRFGTSVLFNFRPGS